MRIRKIKIKNLFGIKEYELGGESIELSGKNGVGKSSVIDAIKYALTNKSHRDYIVRNGETEGEVIIETDNGLRINRKTRLNQADYKSVKKDGREIGSPESFLKDIFTTLQLSPIEFIEWDKKKQNAAILDMIEYEWDMNSIKEWFGEIPDFVSYDQNILAILDDIQSEKGNYFIDRQNINRDIRNKRAFIDEIGDSIPAGYLAEEWEDVSLGEIYREIEVIKRENEKILRAKALIENKNNKLRGFDAEKEIGIATIEREFSAKETNLKERIASLEEQVRSAKLELSGLSDRKKDKLSILEESYKKNIAQYDSTIEEFKDYAGKEIVSTAELEKRVEYVEEMKLYVNEYRRMEALQEEVERMTKLSESLTTKINKARELPGEILEKANIPIENLTVKDGIPLINNLPVSNLSDGEKLSLCIDVALQKPNGLQIILIDGVERLSSQMREVLYEKCKNKGLQFIATRTTDDEDLTVIEL